MTVEYSEQASIDSNCEIRLGIASWDGGGGSCKSVKYAWQDAGGKTARGGEIPVEALPQMLDFAIRKGYLTLR